MCAPRPLIAGHRDVLGEGPWWDDEDDCLVWVDIASCAIRRWGRPERGLTTRTLPAEVSLALPRRGGGYVAGQVDHLVLVDPDGTHRPFVAVDADNPHTRLNDGCCDDAGRLWVGTYSTRGEPEAGLYVVGADGRAVQVLSGQVASNGVAWSGDGSRLHVVDTGRCVLETLVVSDDEGVPSVTERSTLVAFDPEEGRPDGIAIDAEDAVWVAMWGGGQVRRYRPDGSLDAAVEIGVDHPTAIALGGPDLATAYVTSTSRYAGAAARREGSVFAFGAPAPGMPVRRFAG